jgi:transposase
VIGLPSLSQLDGPPGVRISLAAQPADMRCGFDRLAELARSVCGQDPFSGHLFLFRTRAGCWAHARRKFVDAEKTHPAIAPEAVELVRRLYAVEAQAADKSASERLHLRQSQSQPILAHLRERLVAWKDQLLPKHPMAQTVGYTLNQWAALNVFAADGLVPIDNNISEREMKRIVLNRKNSMFVGNERGGRTAAILSSLTSTCRRHEVDPQRYLTQLLTNLPGTPMSQLDQWLPDRWKLNQAATAV